MNNQCINFRQRTKTKNKRKTVYFYCAEQRKEITFEDCRGCIYKEYKKCTKIVKNCAFSEKKHNKMTNNVQKPLKMNQKSRKLAKLERERFSLFTDNKDKCMFCNCTYQLTWHEIYCGRNRQNSMRLGLCLRMCLRCHEKYQEDKQFNEYWKKKGQTKFNEVYPNLEFEKIFKKNYL